MRALRCLDQDPPSLASSSKRWYASCSGYGCSSTDSVQADGGVMMGLPRAEALELAAQSEFVRVAHYVQFSNRLQALQGAARMVLQHGAHPAQIKDSVTSTFFSICVTILHLLTLRAFQ